MYREPANGRRSGDSLVKAVREVSVCARSLGQFVEVLDAGLSQSLGAVSPQLMLDGSANFGLPWFPARFSSRQLNGVLI